MLLFFRGERNPHSLGMDDQARRSEFYLPIRIVEGIIKGGLIAFLFFFTERNPLSV